MTPYYLFNYLIKEVGYINIALSYLLSKATSKRLSKKEV